MIEIRLTVEDIQRLRDGEVLYRTEDGSPAPPPPGLTGGDAIAITLHEGHAAVLRDLMGNLGAMSPARQMHVDPAADPAAGVPPDEEIGGSPQGEARPQAGLDHT